MKNWEKPKLIVLVRSQPQEAILQLCKGDGVAQSSGNSYDGCQTNVPQCEFPCNAIGAS